MSNKIYFLIFIIPVLGSCQQINEKSKYPKSVGDINYDSKYDKKDFYLCNEKSIMQYHNDSQGLEYKGEKTALDQVFKLKYQRPANTTESGMVRIRFVVNCKGETDRFRVMSMDEKYNEKIFDADITEQLVSITKSLDGWIPKKNRGKEADYYQYLIFKIKNGQISEILP
ncbi:MAG: hypothetical protein IPM42_06030 [Saprospiraceae bacterium]|nr:hypothetical protein [Saprospiraceae bacterium]